MLRDLLRFWWRPSSWTAYVVFTHIRHRFQSADLRNACEYLDDRLGREIDAGLRMEMMRRTNAKP